MALSINSGVEARKFPLQGIGEYFEKVGKLSHAKHAYKKAITSPAASAIDKANAKYSIKKIDEKLREKDEQTVDVTTSVMLPTKDLKPHPDAEMQMSSQDYKRLKDDVAERGIKIPLAITMQNEVIGGIHRWKAAQELGIKEVPCFVIGITKPDDVKRYSISDNLCRRQLSSKEKRAWIVELLRLRKEEVGSIRGRKKGGPRTKTSPMSNRQMAEAIGVSHETIGKIANEMAPKPLTGHLGPVSHKVPKSYNIVKEDFSEKIVKGKSKIRDANFCTDICSKTKDRIDWILGQMKDGEKLTVTTIFAYEDKE